MTLRFAIPNKGRLLDPTVDLLKRSGMVFERGSDRALTVPVRNLEIELLFVRTDDVVEFVADGVAEIGIAGLDLVVESALDVDVVAELGYGRCRLVAAVPKGSPIEKLEEMAGCRVATSHPLTTARLLAERGILDVETVSLTGSVEVAPKLGVADAIVDLVSSGSTLLVNGLRPVATLFDSQAVLIASSASRSAADHVQTMLGAVVAGRHKRYLMMNAPNEAVAVLNDLIPGLSAPSVLPLADGAGVAIHSVVEVDDLWHVIPELEAAGASGILVLPIEQMVP